MTETPPIACSLKASELKQRLAEIAAVGADSLSSRSGEGGTTTLRFRSEPATRQRLQAIVAAEKECCPFLEFELRSEADELVLTITAPPGGEPVAAGLADAFAGPR